MKFRKTLTLWSLALYLILSISTVEAMPILYGVNPSPNHGLGTLVQIDTATGLISDIGSIGALSTSSLAFSPDGTLFATTTNRDLLLTINPTTGAATVVGNLGPTNVSGIAFDTGGTLFGIERVSNNLVTIDTTTAAITTIGSVGTPSLRALTFDQNGILYSVLNGPDELVTIDVATGALTVIGNNGFDTQVNGLAFAPDGTLFGASHFGAVGHLLTIDFTTGRATTVGPLHNGIGSPITISGLAFDPAPVPEPSTMILLGTGLVGLFVYNYRRKNQAV